MGSQLTHPLTPAPLVASSLAGAVEPKPTYQGKAEENPRVARPPLPKGIRVVTRYRNRRLYDRKDCRYINLDHVTNLIIIGEPFVVIDWDTGEDVTARTIGLIPEEMRVPEPPALNIRDILERNAKRFLEQFGRK